MQGKAFNQKHAGGPTLQSWKYWSGKWVQGEDEWLVCLKEPFSTSTIVGIRWIRVPSGKQT